MCPGGVQATPYAVVYRCRFRVERAQAISFSYSADECAQIFLDGVRLGEGPELGAPERWYLGWVRCEVSPGEHVLTARVVCFGAERYAYARLSVRHGFWVEDESGILEDWEWQIESGCGYEAPFPDWGAYPRVHVEADYNREILAGKGGEWLPVVHFEDSRVLHEPDLPLMRHEKIVPERKSPTLWYFKQYTCTWASYRFSGQGTVKIRWTETPYRTADFDSLHLKGNKGNRDGTYLVGNYDTFQVDGELHWFDYHWHAGHYVEILIEGEVEVLPDFYRTGYPFPPVSIGSPLYAAALETLQACSHETYMDCPYYEQLMYIGDSRLEALCNYHITDDHRLPVKALRLLALSQMPSGALCANYPTKKKQVIPSFMLIYILMLHDYYLLHGYDSVMTELMPVAEGIAGYMLDHVQDGLLTVPGWSFIDWCQGWEHGVPPGGETNSILNWLLVLALRKMAEMRPESDYVRHANELKTQIHRRFYNPILELYADDLNLRHYSEHAQVIALLAGTDAPVARQLGKYPLTECSIYFSFYYLTACRQYGLTQLAAKRLERWLNLLRNGLTTLPEEFDNPRSDCHAWGSYIILFMDLWPEMAGGTQMNMLEFEVIKKQA